MATPKAHRYAQVLIALAITAESGPPSEFRIFSKGENKTTKGTFLFDEQSAKLVMAEYEAHGCELMIDYDHGSIDPSPQDPAKSGRAAAWCGLAVRNGDLWVVNVRWTDPAASALNAKEWRYFSPVIDFDADKRITAIVNVALTNLPAMHQIEALMAANSKERIHMSDSGLSPKLTQAALEAVASKDAKGSLDLLKQILAALLGGDPDATTEDAPPPAGDGGADEGTETPPPAGMSMSADEAAAASRVACALTGKSDPGEAMAELTRRSEVAVDLESREAKLSADRATLEAGERRSLVASLVKLGVEVPATAWSDDKGTVPCKRLASEPIAELRARVATLSKGRGANPGIKTPAGNPGATDDPNGLDARELQICKETGCDPATFAMLKSRRAAQTAV